MRIAPTITINENVIAIRDKVIREYIIHLLLKISSLKRDTIPMITTAMISKINFIFK